MSLELRQLRHVLALAERGSFARAAVALRLSQPALSRSIQSLEQQVGTALFLRSASGVVPTDIGRVLVQRAREVVQMAEDIDREVLNRQSLRQVSHLVVGAGPYPAETMMCAALARFTGAHPLVSVRVEVRNWDELLPRLRTRELDFFVAEISTLAHEPDLDIEAMPEHPLYFVTRPGHPLAGCGGVTPADTFRFPFASPCRIPPRLLDQMLVAQRSVVDPLVAARTFPALESHSLSLIKHIVQISDTITAATLPCIVTELEHGQLTTIGAEPWMNLRYGLVRLKGHPMSSAALRLSDLIFEEEQATLKLEAQLAAKWRPSPKLAPAKSRTKRRRT